MSGRILATWTARAPAGFYPSGEKALDSFPETTLALLYSRAFEGGAFLLGVVIYDSSRSVTAMSSFAVKGTPSARFFGRLSMVLTARSTVCAEIGEGFKTGTDELIFGGGANKKLSKKTVR